MEIEEPVAADRRRKSLAIDLETYEMLREICARERRTLISQLQLMIEDSTKSCSIRIAIENIFKKRPAQIPQSYRPVADAGEVIDLFSR